MFNDGVINMGRVLVLFAFTSQMGQQYPTDAWKFWDIYHAVLKGTEYEYPMLITPSLNMVDTILLYVCTLSLFMSE
jgi:hypothetical protein